MTDREVCRFAVVLCVQEDHSDISCSSVSSVKRFS